MAIPRRSSIASNRRWAVDRGVAITLTGSLTGYLTQF
jgi:hypothetical protein